MTLQIKIGASAQVYDNVATANAMRGTQKLSITGTGEEIKTELAAEVTNGTLSTYLANAGSIKATNDLNLNASDINTYKAALVKLGTKSIVLDSGTLASDVSSQFNALDAVYTKIKSLTISDITTNTPAIAVEKLATAVNLGGLEVLSGKQFNVTGTATTIKANMDSLLKNISKIGTITVAAGSEAVFNAQQLTVLGDKLKKADNTAKITLNDTADNILTTANLALINKLNNTNLNAPSSIATVSANANNILTADKSFNTGDAVTYNGAVAAKDGSTYYARKLSNTSFSIFTSYAAAVDTSSNTGIVSTTGMLANDTFTSQVGNSPIRNTTLDNVNVKAATVDQAKRFVALTAVKSGIGTDPNNPATVTRDLSNIIASVEIADTADILNAGALTQSASAYSKHATDAGQVTLAGHNYKTGDAVTYSVASGQTGITELTNGATYYVGRTAQNTFVLFDTQNAALTADLTSLTTAATGGAKVFGTGNTATASNLSFTNSTLDNTMSGVARFKDNTGVVGRVTIKGDNSAITSTTLNDIATKALRGATNATTVDVAYAAKAVQISSNLQALYDNKTVTTASHLTEIVVTDGTVTGKKGFSMSQAFYTALSPLFTNGVDHVLGGTNNKNYSYTVTGAAAEMANPSALQADVNVASYNITGVSFPTLNNSANLVALLSNSKLRSVTTAPITDAADRRTITNLVNQIGNPVDRAKLKIMGA